MLNRLIKKKKCLSCGCELPVTFTSVWSARYKCRKCGSSMIGTTKSLIRSYIFFVSVYLGVDVVVSFIVGWNNNWVAFVAACTVFPVLSNRTVCLKLEKFPD